MGVKEGAVAGDMDKMKGFDEEEIQSGRRKIHKKNIKEDQQVDESLRSTLT